MVTFYHSENLIVTYYKDFTLVFVSDFYPEDLLTYLLENNFELCIEPLDNLPFYSEVGVGETKVFDVNENNEYKIIYQLSRIR